MNPSPLSDFKVLNFSKILADPLCAQYLGDMGAEVIKVAVRELGDDTRRWPPFRGRDGMVFLSENRNKRSIAVGMKTPDGRMLCLKLAAAADVVIESFRLGVAARLRIDAATLRAINPRIFHCAISGFGSTGPMWEGKGYNFIPQAFSGMLSITGEPGGNTVRSPFSPSDHATGIHALVGSLAALHECSRTEQYTHRH